MKGIIGKKVGMTQIFNEDGSMVPVTVVEAGPIFVTQVKTVETDGYNAVQVAFGDAREKTFNKPEKGHFAKSGVAPKKFVIEFRVDNPADYTLGQSISAEIFEAGQMVDVSGTSKGKGTEGPIRRWNQSRGPMSHGSKYKRGVGSLGANSTPARVLKGQTMAGRMGNEKVTVQNLELVRVDAERNLLLIKGAVPGPKGGFVTVQQAVKAGK